MKCKISKGRINVCDLIDIRVLKVVARAVVARTLRGNGVQRTELYLSKGGVFNVLLLLISVRSAALSV